MFRHWLLVGLIVGCGINFAAADDLPVEASAVIAVEDGVPTEAESAPPKPAGAAATPNSPSERVAAPTAEQLQHWTQDLVSPKFAIRQAASQKLVQAGKPGMDVVASAATTDDLELATRCLAVLTEGLKSKTEDIQRAARTALENLAKSENKSVAQRARTALEPTSQIGAGGGVRIGGGNFQQVRVQIANGVRQIHVLENGKEILIKDNNGKEISVATTETVDGKKVTQTVTGKDEDDLKQNHPEAHTLFSKYSKGGNGVQIQFGLNGMGNGNMFRGAGPQPLIARRRLLNPIKANAVFDEVDKLRQQLEEANERLSKAADSDTLEAATIKAISAEIKVLTNRLREIKAELQLP